MRPRPLRKSLLAAIEAVSFTAIILCIVCFAFMLNSINTNTMKQSKEANELLIEIVLNGFVQSEGASLDYALKHASLAMEDISFENDDDLAAYGFLQVYDLLEWESDLDQYFFIARSGEITTALTIDGSQSDHADAAAPIPAAHMTQLLIDADMAGASFYDITLSDLLMPEYAHGAIYSSQDKDIALMVMISIGEDDVFGMFLPHAQSFRLIEALHEVADDTQARNDRDIREIATRYVLILIIIGTVLLSIIAVISRRLSLTIAQPVEREKEIMEHINALKTEFLANISHELKIPLTIIGGHAQHGQTALRDVSGTNDTQHDLRLIASEADRLALMVSQVLDLSQIEEGRMEFTMRPCAVMEIISQTFDIYYPVFGKNHNTLRVIPSSPPPVICDSHRVMQVLVNLISNAAKHTRDGVITIGAAQEGGYVRIWVEDTGDGIPAEVMDSLFERYRIKKTPGDTGTGLGLSISKYIVEEHGGVLEIKSEIEKGTTASFTLPIADSLP